MWDNKRNNLYFLYIKERRGSIILFFLSLVIMLLVTTIIKEEFNFFLYTALLITFVVICAIVVDFIRFRKTVALLISILEDEDDDQFKYRGWQFAVSPKERLFGELLCKLSDRNISLRQAAKEDLARISGYYTLWAHEIKTPVSALRLLIRENTMEEKSVYQGELFKIEESIDTLLGYVRQNTASTDYVFAVYSLDELLRKSIRKYAPVFIRKKIDLKFIPSDSKVLTDEKWFCFIIDQLLSNALKYTERGIVTIGMKGESIYIKDTGIGISKEDMPRIRDLGYTGYNGRTEEKSTGIGLALCDKITQAMSLRMEIESEVGLGTTVYIVFSQKNLSKM